MVEKELILFQNKDELEPEYRKSYQHFWIQKNISERYLELWNKVEDALHSHPSTVFSRAKLQCDHPASFQTRKRTENY